MTLFSAQNCFLLKTPPSQNVHLPTTEFIILFGSVIAGLCRYWLLQSMHGKWGFHQKFTGIEFFCIFSNHPVIFSLAKKNARGPFSILDGSQLFSPFSAFRVIYHCSAMLKGRSPAISRPQSITHKQRATVPLQGEPTLHLTGTQTETWVTRA